MHSVVFSKCSGISLGTVVILPLTATYQFLMTKLAFPSLKQVILEQIDNKAIKQYHLVCTFII